MSIRCSFATSAATLSLISTTIFAIPSGFAAPQDAEGVPASEMEVAGRLEIERSLSQELQSVADRQTKLPGQTKFDVSVGLSIEQRALVIDLGKNSIPSRNSFRVEEQCHSLITTAKSIVDGIVSVNGYECTYGGKDIFYYHPEEMPVVKKKS